MTRHDFQLAPRDFFAFFVIADAETEQVGIHAQNLAQAFCQSVRSQSYGAGVKSITATLILTDPEGSGRMHKVKGARYSPGRRTIKAHGLTVIAEDTLEFSLRPSIVEVRNASTESQVAAAMLPTLVQVRPQLERLNPPNFDMGQFLSDLEAFLRRAGVARTH